MRPVSFSPMHGLDRKKRMRNLSLFSGEAGRYALGRFPGLGFVLLAAPSHPNFQGSGLIAAFVAITVAGPRRLCTGLPFEPRAVTCERAKYNERVILSRVGLNDYATKKLSWLQDEPKHNRHGQHRN